MKGPAGKSVGGIYCNPRFIHTAASLVGCNVYIQVKSGAMYEGVFHTFSQKVDIVLEMAVKVDKKSNNLAAMMASRFDPNVVTEKMIFKISDVISLSALNVDLEYATRDSFTDAAISRFNGQVHERVLEPWDGGLSNADSLSDLGADEVSNGWAADEMFRTNEMKYGVKSSFDNTLLDYTIPLKKQNTEEYKLQEAKASKIAQEIESGTHHKNRAALENGSEEERFSAVVRTENSSNSNAVNNNNNNNNNNGNNNNTNRFIPHRPRKPQGARLVRSSPSPNAHTSSRMSYTHVQHYPKPSQSQQVAAIAAQAKVNAKPATVVPPIPKPVPPRPPVSSSQVPTSSALASGPQPASSQNSCAPVNSPVSPSSEEDKVNGDVPRTSKQLCNKDPDKSIEPSKEAEHPKELPEKKTLTKKASTVHDDKTEDLKRFHEKFKLPESKEPKERTDNVSGSVSKMPSASEPDAVPRTEKKSKEEVTKGDESENMKNSSLNPNAKEFVLNPNAKTFTPRGLSLPVGMMPPPPAPAVQPPPPRLHAQNPVIAVPPTHLVPGMPHPVFNVAAPHYVLPATPVSVPIAPPYTPASSVAQAPRYRKAMPMTLPRNDSSQSIHVQAATGQPILAPPTLSTPQFAIQYTPSPGILHPTGPPQHQLAYTQVPVAEWYKMPLAYAKKIGFESSMYSMMGQRVLTPQPLGMVSAASYGETPHVPTQIYMNPQAVANVAAHQAASANSGQHSTPSTPQSQTPNLHPAPSPVHQVPPHGQAPTPTGHPSNPPTPQVVYHGQLTTQHPLNINPGSSNHSHPYPAMYGAGPQPIMLLPQQPMPGPHHTATFSAIQNHFQTPGPHGATPTPIIPHPPPPVAMMPTSTAMAHGQVSVSSNHHYAPHSQV